MHLHSSMVCHKDIKPENILIKFEDTDKILIKLIDFNISQEVEDDKFRMFSAQGTEQFMAPEMIKR